MGDMKAVRMKTNLVDQGNGDEEGQGEESVYVRLTIHWYERICRHGEQDKRPLCGGCPFCWIVRYGTPQDVGEKERAIKRNRLGRSNGSAPLFSGNGGKVRTFLLMQPVPSSGCWLRFPFAAANINKTSSSQMLLHFFPKFSILYQYFHPQHPHSNIIGGKMSATVEHATCPECPAAHRDLESGLPTSTAEASILAGEGQQVEVCPPSPLHLVAKP
jgi:hypothetical protein